MGDDTTTRPLVYTVPELQKALGGWSWEAVDELIRAGAFGDPATLPRKAGGRHRLIPRYRVEAWLRGETQGAAS